MANKDWPSKEIAMFVPTVWFAPFIPVQVPLSSTYFVVALLVKQSGEVPLSKIRSREAIVAPAVSVCQQMISYV
ncbi:hypothetical protein H106_02699 [Trichophyton rubrum CBS 735.88]|nr:hypothetical protein H106_02699 [Trichophyton rubrum CBS 735.88]